LVLAISTLLLAGSASAEGFSKAFLVAVDYTYSFGDEFPSASVTVKRIQTDQQHGYLSSVDIAYSNNRRISLDKLFHCFPYPALEKKQFFHEAYNGKWANYFYVPYTVDANGDSPYFEIIVEDYEVVELAVVKHDAPGIDCRLHQRSE